MPVKTTSARQPDAVTQFSVFTPNRLGHSATELNRLMTAFLEAELNINYLYSFIPHPQGKSILGLSMEDNEVAEQVLQRRQFRVLRQTDISR